MEFREWLGFLFGWIPVVGPLLATKPPKKPPVYVPPARVAIIGAGVGGCSAAYFLRELCGDGLDIHVFSDGKIGGRTAVTNFCEHVYETGASVIHTSNKHMVDFREKFGLQAQLGKNSPTVPLGIFDGKKFVIRTGFSSFISSLKMFWRYGFSLIRLSRYIDSNLKDFCKIYDLQDQEVSFKTVPDMLKAMGGDKFVSHIEVSTEDFFIRQLNLNKKLVDEVVCAGLKVNYGQENKVDAFTAMVALAGMQDGSLWCVQGGNKQIPEKALEASKASFHAATVTSVTRETSGSTLFYNVNYQNLDSPSNSEASRFDVVILATPLNLSTIQFSGFPSQIYTTASRTPYHRTIATIIKGKINPEYFGFRDYSRDFPQTILTCNVQPSEIDFNSIGTLIPSEIPDKEVPKFCKPISQDPSRVWKVFSKTCLNKDEKATLFKEIEDEQVFNWMAYPQYNPPEQCPPFVLDDGLFYINGIEKAASAMEMSAIGAKNVSILAKEHIIASKKDA